MVLKTIYFVCSGSLIWFSNECILPQFKIPISMELIHSFFTQFNTRWFAATFVPSIFNISFISNNSSGKGFDRGTWFANLGRMRTTASGTVELSRNTRKRMTFIMLTFDLYNRSGSQKRMENNSIFLIRSGCISRLGYIRLVSLNWCNFCFWCKKYFNFNKLYSIINRNSFFISQCSCRNIFLYFVGGTITPPTSIALPRLPV